MATINPRPYSRPVLERNLTLRSEQAPRIMSREGDRVMRSLHAIAVVFRATLPQAAADQLERESGKLIEEGAEALANEIQRVSAIRASEGVTLMPHYSHPSDIPIRILCPQSLDFMAMVEGLDELIMLIDSLWLSGLLTNRNRAEAAYQWQRRILRIARKIAAIEMAVRAGVKGPGESSVDGPIPAMGPELAPVTDLMPVMHVESP